MPILGPLSKFGAPYGLRGGESRDCVRRPKQNRSVSRRIGQAYDYCPCGGAAKNGKTQFLVSPKVGGSGKTDRNTKGVSIPKIFSNTRMEVKVNFEVYCGAAKACATKPTEPNQALQRINVLVTDRAPSSTLRAKHVHR